VQEAVEFFVAQGSYGLLFFALIAAGMGLPLPEDIVFIAGAVLAQRGITDLTTTVLVLSAGVLLGDSILFFLARRLGPTIYGWGFVKRAMPPARRAWVEDMIRRYGGFVVFCARHVAGFRGPTFAICAIHGISYPVFLIFDALALVVSLPLFMALGWFFSSSIAEALAGAASIEQWILLVVVGLVLVVALVQGLRALLKRPDAAAGEAGDEPPAS
jgi:membrane protein DedA with SNARE-associated domain